MILIADSGTTKTDWALVNPFTETKIFTTEGFNPYYMSSANIGEIIIKELVPLFDENSITDIYYYGSGCSTQNKRMIIDNALEDVFSNARITVEHDLLGAARGLFKNREGIACILGTGSNSCHCRNGAIVNNIPSIGYIYGDEGSGTFLGKQLIKSYLRHELPAELMSVFEIQYGLSLEQILDATYNKEKPMQFMSSFVRFIAGNIDHGFIKNLVNNSFEDFFTHQLTKYPGFNDLPIGFTGSVAYIFKPVLEEVLFKHGLKAELIMQRPIEGLIDYHKQ